MEEENISDMEETSTVTLTDVAGRTITCYLEHSVEIEGGEYVVLLPVDTPVEIFLWSDDADEPIPIDNSVELDDNIFDLAKAVLAEQNLTLKRTAVSLTVVGELPEFEQSEEEPDPDSEELHLVASFYYKQQEYDVYTPMDPLLIIARMNDAGQPELLSEKEWQNIEPLLPKIEDQLLKTLEKIQNN